MPKLGIKDLGFDEIQSQIDAISQSLEAAAKNWILLWHLEGKIHH